MSEEPQVNIITRLIPGLTIICLIIMIAAAIFHVVTLSPTPKPAFNRADVPPAPDYASEEAWLVRPSEELAGGWEKPWGIDLIWFVDQPDGYLGGWNVPIDWSVTNLQLSEEEWLVSEDVRDFGLFSPRRRHAASLSGDDADLKSALALETEDVLSAIDHYLEHNNTSRGIFLGGQGTGVRSAIEVMEQRIADTRPHSDLFGGLIISPNETRNDLEDLPPWPDCSQTITEYPCILDLRTYSSQDEIVAEVGRTLEKFSSWLDNNVTKPAAPLPPFETIELAPIRRPGETD